MTNTAPPDSAFGAGDTRLIPVYTFEEFVVGPHNRFPHAASLAVSENLGKAYNPLFLYGPVGIGKTHLMQSVGHRVLQRDPQARVLYVTAQQFMTEVIELLQAGRLQTLRERYRALDLLLVDDIQFLATSEATQEEFFHMFNDLHASGKQIIMTSDRPPKMLTTLEDRLRSRFEWGLIADIKFTNLETRVAILKKKEGHLKGLHLADDIRLYIASRLKSNIRELEGFLRRIQAYTQLYNEDISLNLVKEILKELLPPEEWVQEGTPHAPSSDKISVPPLNPGRSEMEGFDLQPSQFDPPRPAPPPATVLPPPSTVLKKLMDEKMPDPVPKREIPEPSIKFEPLVDSVKSEPSPVTKIAPAQPLPKEKTDPVPEPARLPSDEKIAPPPLKNPVIMPKIPVVSDRPPIPQSKPDIPTPAVPLPIPTPGPGSPRMPTQPLPLPTGTQPKPDAPPSIPKQIVPPVNMRLTQVPGSGLGGLSPVGIPSNPGQIPVVFFYPVGHDKELVQMKRKFDDIINKHKLKFVLHPALEVDYTPSPTIAVEPFIEKCRQAGVSIGVVLAPSPDTALQEGIFFSRLQEAFDQAQLSLQMVPWDELSKDYRFLNLALDITLIRIKQRKS